MDLREKFKKEKGFSVMAIRQDYADQSPYEDGFCDEYVEWLESKVMPRADLRFILKHKTKDIEIEMPVLSICEEYSTISFSTKEGAYDDEYNGISRIPDTKKDTAEAYDVYVVINGQKYLYDGLFRVVDQDYITSEERREHKA